MTRQDLTLLDELRPERIVELGILPGGSTALMALVAKPEKLVGIEFPKHPCPAWTS